MGLPGSGTVHILPGVVALMLCAMMAMARAGGLDVQIHVHGGDGQAAECMTSKVSGLDPNGDNFLSVRSGPGGSYRELDKLHAGELVTIFEAQGEWVGVVYRTRNPDCFSPVTKPVTFRNKGWIFKRFLTDVAG